MDNTAGIHTLLWAKLRRKTSGYLKGYVASYAPNLITCFTAVNFTWNLTFCSGCTLSSGCEMKGSGVFAFSDCKGFRLPPAAEIYKDTCKNSSAVELKYQGMPLAIQITKYSDCHLQEQNTKTHVQIAPLLSWSMRAPRWQSRFHRIETATCSRKNTKRYTCICKIQSAFV